MKNLILTLAALISLTTVFAAQKESVKNGSFSTANNWNPSTAPSGGDKVVINEGFVMDVTDNWNPAQAVELVIKGTLRFAQNGKKINLPAGSSVTVVEGGKILDVNSNNSNRINIGNNTVYTGNMGNLSGPLFTNGANPLPVTLVSFKAVAAAASVQLNWITSMEENNDRFEIERSTDGVNFETIGMVKGKINSNELVAYSFTDRAPVNGVAYYRLRQVDIDGAFDHSDLVRVEIKIERSITFANPVQGSFVLAGADNATLNVTVLDMSGNVVVEKQVNGGEAIAEISALSAGNYILRISENGNLLKNSILAVR